MSKHPNLQSPRLLAMRLAPRSGSRRNSPRHCDQAPLRNRQPYPAPLERANNGQAALQVDFTAFCNILVDTNYRYMRYSNMKKIAFTAAATRQWVKLSADIRKRIDAKLTIYAANGSGDVKRLKGRGGCRLRVGDWRVIFFEDNTSIIIVAVGNRKEIYD